MIARFFSYIFNSIGVVLRTFRAFMMRQVMGLRAGVRRVTSFSRQAAKLVPKAMSSVAVAGKKPTKREDFVETRRLFIAKSFLVYLVIGAAVLGLIGYFVVWPWMVSKFFTAHLYKQDKVVEAYNGKVVLYYDNQKEAPMVQGRLQEGMLQGAGKAFDEQGRVLYEGTFANGLYDGQGSLYQEGVLVYEGEFAAGLYEGRGKLYEDGQLVYEGGFAGGLRNGTGTAYSNEKPIYKGTFADDLYEGEGSEFYQDGTLKYRGGFAQGLYAGAGAGYYENGQMEYKGEYLGGQYEQNGTLYAKDGRRIYEGGFHAGLYQGDGILRTDRDWLIKGSFEAGAPVGDVEITRDNGKLYYTGQVAGLLPDGEGTLYASNGVAIYRGVMRRGVADIGALLNKPVEEVRTVFADASLIETGGKKAGFSVNNAALGITLFCTYKSEDSDPTVYYVYAYDKNADSFVDAMPWRSAEAYEEQAADYEKRITKERAVFTGGVPYPNGTYVRTAYYYKDYVFIGWSETENGPWVKVEWIINKDLPTSAGAAAASTAASSGRLDTVLATLGLQKEAPAAPPPANPYYAGEDPASAIKSATDKNSLCTLMADYYVAAETRMALEEQAEKKKLLLAAEQKKLSMGTGNQGKADALSAELDKLALGIQKATVAMEKAQLAAQPATLADYDVSKCLLAKDPADMDVEALKKTGDSKAIELAYLDLTVAYQELSQAQKDYVKASEAAIAVQADYATGKADDAALSDTLAAQSNAGILVHQSIHACTVQMLALNALTKGFVATQYQYFI